MTVKSVYLFVFTFCIFLFIFVDFSLSKLSSFEENSISYSRSINGSKGFNFQNFHRRRRTGRNLIKREAQLRGKRSRKQIDTEDELRHELLILERRPRWTPPNSRYTNNYRGSYSSTGSQSYTRNLQQTAVKARDNSVSIDNLIRWKSSAERRIERLEHLLLQTASSSGSTSSSSHGWRDLLRQQELIEENARRIEETHQNIAQMQESLQRQAGLRNLEMNMQTSETAVSKTTSRKQNEIDANSRQITSLKGSLRTLQRQVESLQVVSGSPNIAGSNRISTAGSHRATSTFEDVSQKLRDHDRRLREHDVTLHKKLIDITSLQHQLFGALRKGSARDQAIKSIQQSINNSSFAGTVGGSVLNGSGSISFRELLGVVRTNEERLRNFERRENTSCCSRIDSFSRKMNLTLKQVHEALTHADESATLVRIQTRTLDKVTNRMETQRVVIRRVQDVLANHQRSVARWNRNLQESIRFKTEEINETITSGLMRQLTAQRQHINTHTSRIASDLVDHRNKMRGSRNIMTLQIRQLISDNDDLKEKLASNLQRLNNDVTRNFTFLSTRIIALDQRIISTSKLVKAIDNNTNRKRELETRIDQNRRLLKALQSSYLELEQHTREEILKKRTSFEESVLYLNSTVHRMRAVVQRQSDRAATVSSQLLRFTSENRRMNKRLEILREQYQNHVVQANNASALLRHTMTSERQTLRHEVASRFEKYSARLFFMNGTISRTEATQRELATFVAEMTSRDASRVDHVKKQTELLHLATDNLRRRLTTLDEAIQRKLSNLNASLPHLVDDRTKHFEDHVNFLEEEIAELGLRTAEISRNSSTVSDQMTLFRRYVLRLSRNVQGLRFIFDRQGQKVKRFEKNIRTTNSSVEGMKLRFNSIQLKFQHQDDTINSRIHQVVLVQRKLREETTATRRGFNATRQLIENFKQKVNGTTRKMTREISQVVEKMERLGNQLFRANSNFFRQGEAHENRINQLETLNGTFGSLIDLCKDSIADVKGSINNLHQTDVTLFESMELHERALIEHRKLHRNLTVLSDGVHSMINEHSETLNAVQQVVFQLNETVEEGKEEIQETVAMQVQRHLREIKGLRTVMHNFTDLLQTVLSDQLNQEISIASVRLRQRSVLESLDSQSASIERINTDTIRIHNSVDDAKRSAKNNARRITRALQMLSSQQQHLQNFDSIIFRLTDLTSQLNTSLATQNDDITELDRFLDSNRELIYDVAELLANQQEEFRNHRDEVEEVINSVLSQQTSFFTQITRHNLTIDDLQRWTTRAKVELEKYDINIDFLETRVDLLAGALDSLAFVETNITDLRWELADVYLQTQQNTQTNRNLHKSILNTESMLRQIKSDAFSYQQSSQERFLSTFNRLQEIEFTISESASEQERFSFRFINFESTLSSRLNETTTTVTKISETVSVHQQVIESVVEEGSRRRVNLHQLSEKVGDLTDEIDGLNQHKSAVSAEIEKSKSRNDIQTTAIGYLAERINEFEESFNALQSFSWNANSRLRELTSRTDNAEDQLSILEAQLSQLRSSDHKAVKDLDKKLHNLEHNVTHLGEAIKYLENDVDNAFNFTDNLLQAVHVQEQKLNKLNRSLSFSSIDVFTSIASTIASIEESIQEVNNTLASDVIAISSLLIDFQMAFDTSGRLMEMQHHELSILSANASNYFNFFTSTIDYLKQIVHQTTEAVSENRDRVQHLNNTVVVLRLNAQLLTIDEELGTDNQTRAIHRSDELPLHASQNVNGPTPAGLRAGESENIRGNKNEDDYYDQYGVLAQGQGSSLKTLNSNGPIGSYPSNLEYDVAAVLSGEADRMRIERKKQALLGNTYVDYYEDDYYNEDN